MVIRGGRGRGRGFGRGRGRGRVSGNAGVPVAEESVARSATVEQVGDSHADQVGSVGVAGVNAGVAGVAAGVAQGRDDRIADLLTRLLERLPERVPAQAPIVPPVAEVQPRVAVAEEPPSYLKMMDQLQRIGTGFFQGGAKPEEADEWRRRMERNFRSIRCPEGYRVDLAVHYLEGDAHLWWRGVAARRVQAEMSWEDFVAEFNSKYFPQETLDRLERRFLELSQGNRTVREYEAEFNRLRVYGGHALDDEQAQVRRFLRGLRAELRNRCLVRSFGTVVELVEKAALIEEGLKDEVVVVSPTFQAKKPQHQSGPSKGDKPVQGQKRKWEGTPKVNQGGQGCFGCGSKDHRVASCPQKGGASGDTRVCYHCKEAGHIKPKCPKLQLGVVAVAPPARQAAVMPRVYSMVESGGPSSRPITGKYLDLLELSSCLFKLFVL